MDDGPSSYSTSSCHGSAAARLRVYPTLVVVLLLLVLVLLLLLVLVVVMRWDGFLCCVRGFKGAYGQK